MSQFLLINRVQVQDANAIAGFTWGFPAITHFLGFSHNLLRKLSVTENFNDISLDGCAVIVHKHHVHTYGSANNLQFTQHRNPPYLHSHNKSKTPSVIEEGKMNMTVSLLIKYDGNIGNRQDSFLSWVKNKCFLQRLAGGTILKIGSVEIYSINNHNQLSALKRKLLPGFILRDRSSYLEKHYHNLLEKDPNTELLDAWLDFSMLKQKARPKCNLITKYFMNILNGKTNDQQPRDLAEKWFDYLNKPYQEAEIPNEITLYFDKLEKNVTNSNLLIQWQSYSAPNESTDAEWEYIKKPQAGYLVPIMNGYKAISKVYDNQEIANTRDNETPVCFVESVHSIGEWQSVHRINTPEELTNYLWFYHYEDHWYLCKQNQQAKTDQEYEQDAIIENLYDEFI